MGSVRKLVPTSPKADLKAGFIRCLAIHWRLTVRANSRPTEILNGISRGIVQKPLALILCGAQKYLVVINERKVF